MPDRSTLLFVVAPHIRQALRQLLERENWRPLFADNGNEALDILQQQGVELVVAGFHLPDMTGPEFLGLVRKRFPQAFRLLLCGDADKRGAGWALAEGCAQQLIHLPWDDAELPQILRRYLQQLQAQRQKGADLQTLLNNIPSLPSLPSTYLELRDCLDDPAGVNLERVTYIVSSDIGTSAVLLRWANSALSGQLTRVETVRRAVVVLGTDLVEWLVLSRALKDTLGSKEVPGFDFSELQTHSVGCAVLARMLARRQYPDSPEIADRAFIAAMLHDLGKLVEAEHLTDHFRQAVAHAIADKGLLVESEAEINGFSHAEIGSYLAAWWNMPSFIVNAARWHHDPGKSPADRGIVTLVHVANSIIQEFGVGRSGNHHPPPVDRERWERFDLTPEFMAQMQAQVKDLSNFELE